MCGCECCIYSKSVHSSLLSWRDSYLKKLKDQIQNAQKRRSGEKSNHIYETYKNTVMPHGNNIYAKAYDMVKATICTYTQSDYALPHCRCVMQRCAKCTDINIPDQKTDDQYSNTSPSISFHIYQIIARCTTHGRLTLSDKNFFR